MSSSMLVIPTVRYQSSFIEALEEYQQENRYSSLSIANIQKNFDAYVSKLIDRAQGKHLPEGYVPMTRFWLIDEDIFIGIFDIRHSLTPKLRKIGGHIGYSVRPTARKKGYGSIGLQQTLEKAKQMGLKQVLLTCDDNNLASAKIIEKNGGKLEDKIKIENGKPLKRRYWIRIE